MKLAIRIVMISLAIITGCNQSRNIQVIEYGFWSEHDQTLEVILNPKQFNSFDSLCNRIEAIVCNDSIPILEVHSNRSIKRIRLINPCWEQYACILIRRNNVFKIKNNSIRFDKEYDFSLMDSLMNRHYSNFGKSPYFSDDPRKVIISITYDKQEFLGMSKILDDLTNSFDKLNIETPFLVQLDKEISPPPPPSTEKNLY